MKSGASRTAEMMTRPIRVLHLEDSPLDAELVRNQLDVQGVSCDIRQANSRDSFEAALTQGSFDLILCDYNLPGYDGVAALKRAQQTQADVPVIFISGTVGEEEGVKCLQIGATDYLLKGRLNRLGPAVERAIQEAETQRTRKQAEHALRQRERALCENEERTSLALGAARMGVWEIDFATTRLTWSDTMAPVFGLTQDNVPKTIEDFFQSVHPDDRSAMKASVERAIAGERDFVVEYRAIWPDGSAHWVHGRAQASYEADGTPIRLLGIGIDIDQRKLLQARLDETSKDLEVARLKVLKATMRTVQDIVGNALMSLYLFRTEVEGLASPKALELFDQTIRDTAAKLNALGDLDRVAETQMAMGAGIEVPSGSPKGAD